MKNNKTNKHPPPKKKPKPKKKQSTKNPQKCHSVGTFPKSYRKSIYYKVCYKKRRYLI